MPVKRSKKKPVVALEAYSVEETAQVFGVGTSTIRRRIEDGVIPTIPALGRVMRIPRAWVNQQLAVKEPPAGPVERPEC
jgi:excisionase family DNA binding protein